MDAGQQAVQESGINGALCLPQIPALRQLPAVGQEGGTQTEPRGLARLETYLRTRKEPPEQSRQRGSFGAGAVYIPTVNLEKPHNERGSRQNTWEDSASAVEKSSSRLKAAPTKLNRLERIKGFPSYCIPK